MNTTTVAADWNHRPHDLLWVDDPSALTAVDGWPAWATTAWLAVAPAVVRRAPLLANDRWPVGLRGATRNERCAAHAVGARVIRRVTPEDVARRTDRFDSPLPCLRTLEGLAPSLDALALPWGVTGSVGFTLASGLDVLRGDSDLDLLVRLTDRRDALALRELSAIVQAADCRVDVQVEAARGAFALNEWLRTGGPVLLKTSLGPLLCDDPWDEAVSTAGSLGSSAVSLPASSIAA